MLWCSQIKFEILQITWKKWNKEHQTLSFEFFINKSSIWMLFVSFFHVVCKIPNIYVNRKAFGAASCTQLTLKNSSTGLKKNTIFSQRFPPHPIGPPGLNPILLKVNLPKNHQVNLVQKGKNQEILRILLLGESLLQTLLMELSSG